MVNPRCDACRYAVPIERNPFSAANEPIRVECRRYPPDMIAVQGPQGLGGIPMPRVVAGEGWCGEFAGVVNG